MAKMDPSKILNDLYDYVAQYGRASEAVHGINGAAPITQIRGQWIELALKTYLAASGEYTEGHDLVELVDKCAKRGLALDDADLSNIIEKINPMYVEFEPLNWKYPSRYPMENRPTFVWVTPGHAQVADVVERVLGQATARRDSLTG